LSALQAAWPFIAFFISAIFTLCGLIISHRSLKQRQKEWETARMEAENKRAVEIVKREGERDKLIGQIGRDLQGIVDDHKEYGRKIDKFCEAWASLTGKTINGIDFRPSRESD
jgi:succinate dehydrogenase/fumarate reductase flavoprotein subunit